ncbi:hypothetical protein H7347_05650 [Corynebacterium sp. zg-331]|uniref:hypothetical protein n=1 Tax=unclassified Corynebacterium TaxID=2624378 RepID=UPI00128E630E|nr:MULTISPECIES: hypothetical protein [unclassified Corynebacterium]MBC3186063.1 hypothetical protein [Corynebacterium sp. zg-331]MPV52553.1 hypothetical protein [Corynebacterium sp. zg331]
MSQEDREGIGAEEVGRGFCEAVLMVLHFHEQIGFLESGHGEPALIAPHAGFCWDYVPREALEHLGEEGCQRLVRAGASIGGR